MGNKSIEQLAESGLYKRGFTCETAHGHINYTIDGNPEAPVIVCLHGLNASIKQFTRFTNVLSQAGFFVINLDFYGHGLSSTPKLPEYSTRDYGHQIDCVLGQIGLSAALITVVGFSMGGLIAAEYAYTHPDTVKRVVLLSPAGMIGKQPKRVKMMLNKCGGCTIPTARDCGGCCSCLTSKDDLEDRYYAPEKRNEEINQAYEQIKFGYKRYIETTLKCAKGMNLWDNFTLYEGLALTEIPTFFAWGQHDDVCPLTHIEGFLRARFVSSPILVYPDCKHQILEEAFDDLIKDVLSFLKLFAHESLIQSMEMSKRVRAGASGQLPEIIISQSSLLKPMPILDVDRSGSTLSQHTYTAAIANKDVRDDRLMMYANPNTPAQINAFDALPEPKFVTFST